MDTLFGLAVGLIIGWVFPKPQFAENLRTTIANLIAKQNANQ